MPLLPVLSGRLWKGVIAHSGSNTGDSTHRSRGPCPMMSLVQPCTWHCAKGVSIWARRKRSG